MKVQIYGAGSIGNHLTYACRCKGWDVTLCDIDPAALQRTKEDIYPARYGSWDDRIRLATIENLKADDCDLVVVGTPPDTHFSIAKKVLGEMPPKCLLIEKPLCTPSMEGCDDLLRLAQEKGTFVGVGYNHTLTQNTVTADALILKGILGLPLTISAMFREHWGGIFAAHPWLNGPRDTYLGYSQRGGGASGEHSHAINIWQHFAHSAGLGRIVEVSAVLDIIDDGTVRYDRLCLIHVRTESGAVGDIIQDVITEPAQKSVRIQGTEGFVEWFVNYDKEHDAVRYKARDDNPVEEMIPKTRPDDFKKEIDHLELILQGESPDNSPISLRRGLETMLVIAAVHLSHQHQRTVRINYDAGFGPDAVVVI